MKTKMEQTLSCIVFLSLSFPDTLLGARGVMMCSFEEAPSGLINPAQMPQSPHLTEWACGHQAALRDAPLR